MKHVVKSLWIRCEYGPIDSINCIRRNLFETVVDKYPDFLESEIIYRLKQRCNKIKIYKSDWYDQLRTVWRVTRNHSRWPHTLQIPGECEQCHLAWRGIGNSIWIHLYGLDQVYAARNAEVLTCHEVQLKEINIQPDWVEFDPLEIWQNVCECIEGAVRNLVILDINPNDIIALAVTNQRETTLLWNSETGKPLYNAIGKSLPMPRATHTQC